MRKKISLIAFIFILVSHTIAGGIGVPHTAIAKELGQSILTNVKLKDENGSIIDAGKNHNHLSNLDSVVNVNYDWTLTGLEVNGGDTYSFKLPAQLKVQKKQQGKITSSDNIEVGTFNVAADGTVTVTFNEEVKNHAGSGGKLTIAAAFNKEIIGGNEKISIPFNLKEQKKVINVSFEVDSKQESEKIQKEDEKNQNVEAEEKKDEKVADEKDEVIAETEEAAKDEDKDIEDNDEENLTVETQDKEKVESDSDIQVLNDEEQREPKLIEENIIKNGTLVLEKSDGTFVKENDTLTPGDKFQLKFDWELPENHEYIAGDTFELQLPEQLKIYNEITGELSEFGSYKVTEDGKVTFTFNESIKNHSFVHGYFHVETELNEEKLTSTEDVLEFKVNDEVVEKIAVNYKPKGGQAIAKSGKPANGNNFNADEIEWTVIVNTTRESLTKAIIEDEILAGQELIIDSIELKEAEVNLQGVIIKEKDVVDVGDGNKSTAEKLLLELGDTNKAYKLTFKTKVKEEEKDKEGVTVYKNTARLTSDNKDGAQAGASVSITRPESLVKTSNAFNKGDRSVEWEVKANFNEKNLKKGDTVTDEFTFTVGKEQYNDKFEVVDIEILQVDAFDENGNATKTSDASRIFGYHIEGNKVTYTLKENTNKAFIFKYKTKLKEGEYITHDGKITNKVTLDGETKTSSQGVYQQVGKKEHAAINYETKTIDWKITINADKQDLRNFKLKDDFSGSGQKLVNGSIKIEPEAANAKININENDEGFEIDFGNITRDYTITYQTTFDYDFGSEDKKPNFVNKVKLSYETSDGTEYGLDLEDKVDPNTQTKSNGAKKGEPNQQTKEITWSVDINYNKLKLDNARFEDKIADNQSLVEGSVKVYETTIKSDGGVNVGDEVTDQFKNTTTIDNDKITIDFGEINKSYRIEFKTVDKDGIYNRGEKYENTAQFIPRKDETHNLNAHVQLPHQGEFLGKKGAHNKEDWTIDWQIVVNKSKSKLTDIIVADDLGDEKLQLLLEDTIKVTKEGSNETLAADEDYELEVNGNGFKLKFINEFKETNETFIVSYSSYILAQETVDLKNLANVSSNSEIVGQTEKVDTIHVGISTGGGGAEGVTGDLHLKKFEAGSNKPLENVAFVLKTKIGNKEITVREGTTDSEGKLYWPGLKYGKYTLEETVPEGYLAETPLEIELVRDQMPDGVKTVEIKNKRQEGTAKIIKQDAVTKEKLANATFKITNLETNQDFTLTTNEQGIAEADVPFGEYSVKEIKAPKGYKNAKELKNIKIEIGKTTEITIDNHAVVNVSGEKTWIDGNETNRPESITVQLLNGDTVIQEKEVTSNDNWKYTFTDLPKYDESGKEINYTIKEVPVNGYITNIDGVNLINIEKTKLDGEKTWKDGNSEERPKSITVQVLDGDTVAAEKEVTSDDNWKYTFTELPKYDSEGKVINYTINELPVPGYHAEINGTNITNTKSAKIDVEGTKTWKDGNAKDRPDFITVKLLANGEEVAAKKVTAEDNWKYSFTDLPAYDNEGLAIEYTINEAKVEGYKSIVEGYNITNLRVGKTSVEGTKTWKDDDSKERPKKIEVHLLQNGKMIDTQEVSAETDWKYSFSILDEFDKDGAAYKYTVGEKPVAGYKSIVEGYDITNVRVGKTSVEGKKSWKDDNAKDRPKSIKVNLLQNGVVVDTKEVTKENGWKYSFTDLAKYDEEGKAYAYTVKEQGVPGYKSEVNGYDITNTRSDKTSIIVTKGWKDDNSNDRPDAITVNLLQNGKVIDTVEVTAAGSWTYEFTDLEAYDSEGVAYEYAVEEEAVEGYESTVDGFDITNLRVSTTSVEVTKTWKDDNSSNRPEMIKVDLLQNGKIIHTEEVTADTDWKYTFTGLDKYDEEGKEYTYTVAEQPVEGYKSTVKETDAGFEITNILVTEPEEPGTDPGTDPKEPGTDPKDPGKDPGTDPKVPSTGPADPGKVLGTDTTQPTKPDDDSGKTGNNLPKTATNFFNLILIGVSLLIAGIALLLYRRRSA
ncbi:Cna B-type domain-containing protein [Pueribacillus theae]|uniref:Cna B-type domain-containing protein n=1 Tax=Pueribacillus theae TaxID=2171751 RepID=UPI001403C8D2|nr:Cna B-type domain-containing protein [Pueribacillus theae]